MIVLGTRARQAVIALGVAVAANMLTIVTDLGALPLLDDATDIDALRRFDSITATMGLVELLAMIAAAVFFIRWFNGLHRSLDDIRPGVRRHATWWSIGGWFIPIMNLFRPKQILDDMIRCSDRDALTQPWWAPTWWGLWLIGSFGGNIAGRAFFNADTLDALHSATIVDAVSSAILAAGGVVAIVLVRELTSAIESTRAGAATTAAPAAQPWPEAAPAGTSFPAPGREG
jgi:hypothetical protein